MTAVLVSAKVSVFYSKFNKTFPKSSQRFYLAQTLIKHKKHNQNIGQINYLLLKGFVVRDIFDPKEKVMRTSEYYRFIERHFDLINDYLKYSGWHIENDSILGVVALSNFYSENRTKIDRETSLILFILSNVSVFSKLNLFKILY